MKRTRFDRDPCPIARATDVMGDWWTPIIMREAFLGASRFGDFVDRLDVPRATLAKRLERLVEDGLLSQTAYQDNPPRYEYRMTEKGFAFLDVLVAMWRWGSEWGWPEGRGPAVELVDPVTGNEIIPQVVDVRTGEPIDPTRLRMQLKSSAKRRTVKAAEE